MAELSPDKIVVGAIGAAIGAAIGSLLPGGLTSAKGQVASVDRVHGKIAVRYADGRIDRLRLMTPRSAAAQAGTLQAKGRRVIVYSSNKSGQQVAQYFKRKS